MLSLMYPKNGYAAASIDSPNAPIKPVVSSLKLITLIKYHTWKLFQI